MNSFAYMIFTRFCDHLVATPFNLCAFITYLFYLLFDERFRLYNGFLFLYKAQEDELNEYKKHMLLHFQFVFLRDRKSTRLNSSHVSISYAVFCLKKKKNYLLDIPVLACYVLS